MQIDVEAPLQKLLAYCRANNWAGYEPYDVLNSRLLTALPFLNSRIPRIVLTQVLKRSPINIRPLLLIPKLQNPKPLAVFLSAFLKRSKAVIPGQEADIRLMVERLIALRSPDQSYWCWGYSFPWQTRSILVPRWAPNLVCTSFVADALLDAHEQAADPRCLDMAVSAAEYILNELYWTEGETVASFSYPRPALRNQTYNANFLAAALLSRVHKITGEKKFIEPALRAARHSVSHQRKDGSWYYGADSTQAWIDNFHTAYNLCALRSIGQYAETTEFEPSIRRGLEFYIANFVHEDGSVKYFHDRTYPIDTHCIAQTIITLLTLQDLNPDNVRLAHQVFQWTMDHMWDDRGYFYYQVHRYFTNRTSYMRHTQAWMFLALTTLLCDSKNAGERDPQPSTVLAER